MKEIFPFCGAMVTFLALIVIHALLRWARPCAATLVQILHSPANGFDRHHMSLLQRPGHMPHAQFLDRPAIHFSG